MNLASISENKNREKRIAITPEIVKKYIGPLNQELIDVVNLLIK